VAPHFSRVSEFVAEPAQPKTDLTHACTQLFAVVPIQAGRFSGHMLGFLGGAGINGGQNNAVS